MPASQLKPHTIDPSLVDSTKILHDQYDMIEEFNVD